MTKLFNPAAIAFAVASSLGSSALAEPQDIIADGGSQECRFEFAGIEVLEGMDNAYVAYHPDGTIIEPVRPVDQMPFALFQMPEGCSDDLDSMILSRQQVIEEQLLHEVLLSPSQDMIEAEIVFGGKYINTEEEALESLSNLRSGLIPSEALSEAFNELATYSCSLDERNLYSAYSEMGLNRSIHSRIELDTESLDAGALCPNSR